MLVTQENKMTERTWIEYVFFSPCKHVTENQRIH